MTTERCRIAVITNVTPIAEVLSDAFPQMATSRSPSSAPGAVTRSARQGTTAFRS
jgi:hypothetical protein